ncbi:MAG: hypothetical protein QXI16_04195 [Sulfolobaceae archaeon]
MKYILNKIKILGKKVIDYYKYIPNIIRHLIILFIVVFSILYPITLVFVGLVLLLVFLFIYFKNKQFLSYANGNGIIYGGRGKGKGLMLNYRIRKDKTFPFCNVPYDNSELLTEPIEYLNSIKPLTIDSFISGDIKHIPKLEKFEKRNIYLDDVNIYLPNWADSQLKKTYQSMPPMIAINRHLYDAFMIITTQDRERPYKLLKELQSDFSMKAIKTYGKDKGSDRSHFWQCIPILNHFIAVKYIYHEIPKSQDMLPFEAKGIVNETLKHGYLSSGQATKEVYEATNGKIFYGYVIQLKKHVSYDTRYFHKVVYGKEAPKD